MKRFLLLIIVLFCYNASFAQVVPSFLDGSGKIQSQGEGRSFMNSFHDPNLRMAVGIQYIYPVAGVSVKWSVTDASVIQAIANPNMIKYGDYAYSFCGARYIYRFPFNNCSFYGPFTASYPYVFAGGGVLSYYYPHTDAAGHTGSVYNSSIAYNFGVGYELIVNANIGLSMEAGFGSMMVQQNNTGNMASNGLGSLGIHIYDLSFGRNDPAPTSQEQATDEQPEMDDQEMQPNTGEKAQPKETEEDDDAAAKQPNGHRKGSDDGDE